VLPIPVLHPPDVIGLPVFQALGLGLQQFHRYLWKTKLISILWKFLTNRPKCKLMFGLAYDDMECEEVTQYCIEFGIHTPSACMSALAT